jgi:hypothetical protein
VASDHGDTVARLEGFAHGKGDDGASIARDVVFAARLEFPNPAISAREL